MRATSPASDERAHRPAQGQVAVRPDPQPLVAVEQGVRAPGAAGPGPGRRGGRSRDPASVNGDPPTLPPSSFRVTVRPRDGRRGGERVDRREIPVAQRPVRDADLAGHGRVARRALDGDLARHAPAQPPEPLHRSPQPPDVRGAEGGAERERPRRRAAGLGERATRATGARTTRPRGSTRAPATRAAPSRPAPRPCPTSGFPRACRAPAERSGSRRGAAAAPRGSPGGPQAPSRTR